MSAENQVTPPEQEEASVPTAFEAMEQMLREKILFGLRVYPALSPSMLHVFLGTATPKSIWKDVVLEKLLLEGLVTKTEVTLTSPYERTQTYTVLHLTDNAYTQPEDAPKDDVIGSKDV